MKNKLVYAQGTIYKNRLDHYLSLVIEYGIYLYAFMMFFDKGEGLRSIGLYGALSAWLILVLFTKRIAVSINIITISLLLFITSTVLSSFFSIDPFYSLGALKKDVLKTAIIFLIVSTYFNNRMLLRISKVICLSGLIILALGLYSLLSGQTGIYTTDNIFLSLDKNEYGFFVGLFLPFFFIFLVKSDSKLKKRSWGLASLWGVSGTILSASKGAIGNIFVAIIIFTVALFKKKHTKMLLIAACMFILIIILSFKFWPEPVKNVFLSIPQNLSTFNERTYLFWEPAVEAAKKRPFLGWGYGSKIYRNPRPFEDGKKPDWGKRGGLHSTFVEIFFHQGIVGLLSYLFLLLSSVFILLKMVKSETEERRLLALSLLSIMIGSFFVNSFVLSVPLRKLAPIIGMSAALYKNRSDM